jgi:hypothetical protein
MGPLAAYLEPAWRDEVAHAVAHLGLIQRDLLVVERPIL